MSYPNKKLFLKKNPIQSFEEPKSSSFQDPDKDCLLFNEDIHKPEYLELPIKIENDLRPPSSKKQQRIQQYSNQSSEHLENNDIFDSSQEKNQTNQFYKENQKDQYAELMNPQHKIDAVDALLMPYYDAYAMMPNEVNQYLSFESQEVKEQGVSPSYQTFPLSKEEDFSEVRRLQQQKKNILSLMNSFRAFTQATSVAINYHKLTKKDSLNKIYNSVFNVLAKESQKLQAALNSQQERFSLLLESERKNSFDRIKKKDKGYEISKQLASTSAGCDHPTVKIEEGSISKKRL